MTFWRRSAPLLISLLGTLGLGGLAGLRIMRLGFTAQGLLATFGLVSYVGWLAWESRVSVAELDKREPDRDHGSMELAALAKLLLLVAALAPATPLHTAAAVSGLVLLLLGVSVRVLGVATLGPRYSHRIRLPRAPLEMRGVYAFVRHPAYAGTLLAHLGVALLFLSPLTAAAWLGLWLPAVILRTTLEERELNKLPEYADYARRVRARLIPHVW